MRDKEIAISASVTVSIGDDIKGRLRVISRLSFDSRLTSFESKSI